MMRGPVIDDNKVVSQGNLLNQFSQWRRVKRGCKASAPSPSSASLLLLDSPLNNLDPEIFKVVEGGRSHLL